MIRWKLQRRRKKTLQNISEGPLYALAKSELPATDATASNVEFVCLDIETSDLDAKTADLLSVGWVVVRNCCIPLESARRILAKPTGEVGNSATIHGLTDTQVASGEPIRDVMNTVISELAWRVLVVHNAGLDKALLDRLCREFYGVELPVPVLDTLALAYRWQQRRHHLADGESLRLNALRSSYGLPRYSAHDCLADALATAELLLAMLAREGSGPDTRIWPWISR